jgi:hypothetical protein
VTLTQKTALKGRIKRQSRIRPTTSRPSLNISTCSLHNTVCLNKDERLMVILLAKIPSILRSDDDKKHCAKQDIKRQPRIHPTTSRLPFNIFVCKPRDVVLLEKGHKVVDAERCAKRGKRKTILAKYNFLGLPQISSLEPI